MAMYGHLAQAGEQGGSAALWGLQAPIRQAILTPALQGREWRSSMPATRG